MEFFRFLIFVWIPIVRKGRLFAISALVRYKLTNYYNFNGVRPTADIWLATRASDVFLTNFVYFAQTSHGVHIVQLSLLADGTEVQKNDFYYSFFVETLRILLFVDDVNCARRKKQTLPRNKNKIIHLFLFTTVYYIVLDNIFITKNTIS